MLVSLCRMLYDYVERKRKENSGAQLHVTYLVAGNLLQNGHVVSVSLLSFAVVFALPCFVILGSKAELALFAAGAAVCQGFGQGQKKAQCLPQHAGKISWSRFGNTVLNNPPGFLTNYLRS